MIMKNQFKFLIIFFLLLTTAYSQSTVVRGRVYDKTTNEAVAFANVIVMGTDFGAASDLDGNFVIYGLEPGFTG